MKLFLIIFIFLLTSCSFLQNQKLNWDECMYDPNCKEQAEIAFRKGSTFSSVISDTLKTPGGNAASGAAGGTLAYLLTALFQGRKIRKKKEKND